MKKRGQPKKEFTATIHSIRLTNAHYIKFKLAGGVKRLRQLLDTDKF